jgi:hypothetical protein
MGDAGGNIQRPQEVSILCPKRDNEGLQTDDGDQVLQAVKFTDKSVLDLHLKLDEDFQAAGCFTELIRGQDGRSGTLYHACLRFTLHFSF